MKKILALIIAFSLVTVASCPTVVIANAQKSADRGEVVWEQSPETPLDVSMTVYDDPDSLQGVAVSDANFADLAANALYLEMMERLYDEGYGNSKIHIDVSYYSKEYLEEIAFNSQENIYYGHKLSELDELFEGKRYVFSCGDDGVTIAEEFEAYDDTYERVLRNVAIGTGIIVVCVTVTLVTGGFGAPFVAGSATSAVNVIFSTAAIESTAFALSGGTISTIITGVTVATQTNDWEATKKAMALAGSEGYMWGAVVGAGKGGFSGAVRYGQALKAVRALPQTPLDEILKYTPVDGSTGKWMDGARGNGEFVSNDPVIKQMLADKGLDGIRYRNGVPDFSSLAYDKVEITGTYLNNLVNPNSTQVRQAMQLEAKELLATQRGISIQDVNSWMRNSKITIHEDINMTTLSFVPTEINGFFQHLGGVSEYMARMAQGL